MSSEANTLTDVLARLDQLTDWERKPRQSMRVGLQPMSDLMHRLGNPQLSFQAIHVTGTKGKGSVCALMEAGLLRAGLRAGRYASPHVERITERVSILGQPVDEANLAQALTDALNAREAAKNAKTPGGDANWFDIMTAAAFLQFRDAGLEWVAVEVGLGGRLDSTNVVNSAVAIVTNVELEHTEILGSTRDAIASEKAGILKPGSALATTLTIDDPAGRILQEHADRLGCQVLRTHFTRSATIQERNTELAGLALDHLGRLGVLVSSDNVPTTPVGAWLIDELTQMKASLPGRLERFDVEIVDIGRDARRAVPVVFDGAHVPFNLEAVLRDLDRQPDLKAPCIAIAALGADKDALGFLQVLSRFANSIVITSLPNSDRGHSPEVLSSVAASLGLACDIEEDPKRAFHLGFQRAVSERRWLLVTGSLYLVGALRGLVVDQPSVPN